MDPELDFKKCARRTQHVHEVSILDENKLKNEGAII